MGKIHPKTKESGFSWCVCEGEHGTFMLTIRAWGSKLSARTYILFAYLFDEDGAVFTEPVAKWTVGTRWLKSPDARRSRIVLDTFARSIASGGSSPYDYRDKAIVLRKAYSLPVGSRMIFGKR